MASVLKIGGERAPSIKYRDVVETPLYEPFSLS